VIGADSFDDLFGGDESFEDDLPDGAVNSVFVCGFDFEHDHFFFDLIEPKFFVVFANVEVEAIDFGFASPGCFVPESSELPNSTDVPASDRKKYFTDDISVHSHDYYLL